MASRWRRACRSCATPPHVIILSMHADESYIIRALAAGARAYLLKDATDEDLIPALRAAAAGKPFFSPSVTAVLVEDYVGQLRSRGLTDSYHLLTDREREVLQLLAEGRSNKEVAALLDVGSVHGRNAPRQPDAEAEPAQHRRDRALRGSQGHHSLAFGCRLSAFSAIKARAPRAPRAESRELRATHCLRAGRPRRVPPRPAPASWPPRWPGRAAARRRSRTRRAGQTRRPRPASTGLNARPTSDAVVMMPKPVTCASAGRSAPATL